MTKKKQCIEKKEGKIYPIPNPAQWPTLAIRSAKCTCGLLLQLNQMRTCFLTHCGSSSSCRNEMHETGKFMFAVNFSVIRQRTKIRGFKQQSQTCVSWKVIRTKRIYIWIQYIPKTLKLNPLPGRTGFLLCCNVELSLVIGMFAI